MPVVRGFALFVMLCAAFIQRAQRGWEVILYHVSCVRLGIKAPSDVCLAAVAAAPELAELARSQGRATARVLVRPHGHRPRGTAGGAAVDQGGTGRAQAPGGRGIRAQRPTGVVHHLPDVG